MKKTLFILPFLVINLLCSAQTWINWTSVNGSNTAAANNPVTGAVSVSAVYGGSKNDIFYSPIPTLYRTNLKNNFNGASITNQVLLQEFSSSLNTNTTSVTFTFEKAVKILEFVVTDPDASNATSLWDDSFSIALDGGATFGAVSSGISNGGNTGEGDLTSGGAVVTTSSFNKGTYQNRDSYGSEWIIWKDSSAKVKSITINFTLPNNSAATLPAVLYYAIKVDGYVQASCSSTPAPQFANNVNNTVNMNGVDVTRTLTRALFSPGNTSMPLTTYCSSSYAANYAFIRSNDTAAKQSATYSFSVPQNTAQFFLMVMGNNQYGTINDRDEALFSLLDDKGNAITNFTLSKNPAAADCHNLINIDNTTHIVSTNTTTKVTSDAAIVVNSPVPFKSVTIADNRNNVGGNAGFGFYVEICPNFLSQVCYRPANTVGTPLKTIHGITALQRAGSSTAEWPGIISGAQTALEAKTKGLVINRMASPETSIANPTEGMMVFDTDDNSGEGCLKLYDGTSWKCLNTQTCGN